MADRMTRDDVSAYLEGAPTTDEQVDAIIAAAEAVERRFAGREHLAHENAFGSAVHVILADRTLEDIATELAMRREAARQAKDDLIGAIIACAGAGQTEMEIIRELNLKLRRARKMLGVNRGTVRKTFESVEGRGGDEES